MTTQSNTLKALLIFTALLCAGCAPTLRVAKVKKTFYGEPRAMSDIAIIRRSAEPAEFTATLSAYAPPPMMIGLRPLDSNTVELQVDPGMYAIELSCVNAHQYAAPKTTFRAAAGITYELACERDTFKGNEIRAKISKTYLNDQGADGPLQAASQAASQANARP